MNVIIVASPIVKLNVAANCLVVVTKDCILRLFSLEMIKAGVYIDHNKGKKYSVVDFEEKNV